MLLADIFLFLENLKVIKKSDDIKIGVKIISSELVDIK